MLQILSRRLHHRPRLLQHCSCRIRIFGGGRHLLLGSGEALPRRLYFMTPFGLVHLIICLYFVLCLCLSSLKSLDSERWATKPPPTRVLPPSGCCETMDACCLLLLRTRGLLDGRCNHNQGLTSNNLITIYQLKFFDNRCLLLASGPVMIVFQTPL